LELGFGGVELGLQIDEPLALPLACIDALSYCYFYGLHVKKPGDINFNS
jgi:hypothetical protein